MKPAVDFCVAISGPVAGLLCRCMFGSLFRISDTSDVTFHIVDKGVPHEDRMIIESLLHGRDAHFYDYNVPFLRPHPKDTAATCEWMMDNCGKNKWVVISHFDIYFKQDFLSNMRRRVSGNDREALFGQHNHMMMLNREAYATSITKFCSIANFYAVRINNDPKGEFKLRAAGDRRIGGEYYSIRGFDTCELMELELRCNGWKVEPLDEEFEPYIYHFGGGGSYLAGFNDFNDEMIRSYRERANKYCITNGF